MCARKTGLDKVVGYDVWILVNHNIHKPRCGISWIRIIDADESVLIVNEAKGSYFSKDSDGYPEKFRYGSRLINRIMNEKITYNRNDVSPIDFPYVRTTDELFYED